MSQILEGRLPLQRVMQAAALEGGLLDDLEAMSSFYLCLARDHGLVNVLVNLLFDVVDHDLLLLLLAQPTQVQHLLLPLLDDVHALRVELQLEYLWVALYQLVPSFAFHF